MAERVRPGQAQQLVYFALESYNNAPMESFWGSMKNELIHHQHYETRTHASVAIQEVIETFYNRQRRHSRLSYQSPAVFVETFNYLQAV